MNIEYIKENKSSIALCSYLIKMDENLLWSVVLSLIVLNKAQTNTFCKLIEQFFLAVLQVELAPNLRTIDFHASGGAVNKYEDYEGIACHNHFKTGPSIYYMPLFRGVGG